MTLGTFKLTPSLPKEGAIYLVEDFIITSSETVTFIQKFSFSSCVTPVTFHSLQTYYKF